MLKNLAFTAILGGWCVCNQDIITIQTSTMIPIPATIFGKCVGAGRWESR